MTLYVVTEDVGTYEEDLRLVGVYSSPERAEKAAGLYGNITQVRLDATPKEPIRLS